MAHAWLIAGCMGTSCNWANQRQQARAGKRWQEADTLRAQIQAAGYKVEDTPQGPRMCAVSA